MPPGILSEQGRSWTEQSGKAVRWMAAELGSTDEWDLAKKEKGLSPVTLKKQEVEQAGVRCVPWDEEKQPE